MCVVVGSLSIGFSKSIMLMKLGITIFKIPNVVFTLFFPTIPYMYVIDTDMYLMGTYQVSWGP